MSSHHSAKPVLSEMYPPGQGDLLVRTSDNAFLGVHSIILGVASLGWKEMNSAYEVSELMGHYIRVQEDRATFECLLSFIYPDRKPLDLESLDITLSVLRAAVHHKMDRVIQVISGDLFDPSYPNNCLKYLMAEDFLRVYAVAKELGLEQLAKQSGALTLAADVYVASLSQEVNKMSTGLYMELIGMRHTRANWLETAIGEPPKFPVVPIEYQDHQRPNALTLEYSTIPLGFYTCSCEENKFDEDGQHRSLPYTLKARILKYPSPIVIEEIDFCKELRCLRCGAAANVFFGDICRRYRETFQD